MLALGRAGLAFDADESRRAAAPAWAALKAYLLDAIGTTVRCADKMP